MQRNKKRKIDSPLNWSNNMFASNRANRFNALPMEEDLSDGNPTYEEKSSKPPPIVIDNNKNMTSIIAFAGEGYFFKRTPIHWNKNYVSNFGKVQ